MQFLDGVIEEVPLRVSPFFADDKHLLGAQLEINKYRWPTVEISWSSYMKIFEFHGLWLILIHIKIHIIQI